MAAVNQAKGQQQNNYGTSLLVLFAPADRREQDRMSRKLLTRQWLQRISSLLSGSILRGVD